MLRCNSEGHSLDSIKLVSRNLFERINLDCSNNDELFEEEGNLHTSVKVKSKVLKGPSKPEEIWSASLKLLDVKNGIVKQNSGKQNRMTDMSMNSNLMFRSMFFMNDEATRHFLAPPLPPIQPCDIQSDYFQKKLMSQATSSNTPGSSSVTTSSTNTGSSVSASNTNTTGTTTTGTNTTNPSLQQTTVGDNKLTITLPKQRPHTCEECGKTFLMKHHLLTHMRVHTGERPYICPECGKSFALKHCLSTHLLLHTADRPYKCNECNKSFTLKHHLVSHERVHTRDRPFECTECGQRFPQKRHLSTHIKFHSGERPFSCQVCGESFSREEHLVMHSRFHGGLSPYNCPDCGAGFLRKFELVNHERQHGRNPESCPHCGKEFLQKRTLLVHMRSCNGSGPGPLPATQQNFSPPRFSESGSPPRFNDNSPPRLNDGMSQRFQNNSNSPRYYESSSNQFRFPEGQMRFNNDNTPAASPMPTMQAPKDKVCKECGETFASVEGLALHLRLHFGDHSFLADICSLAASLKQTAVNVAASLKKTHICTDCGRGFTQRHGLFQHRQRHANGSCKEKPFACEKCGKSFAQKNHLMLHERQHMDLPPRGSKNSQKVSQQTSDTGEQMDTSGEGHQVDRGRQERTSQSSDIIMQNHTERDLLNRHTSESSDNTTQNEKGNINMMMQSHPDHHRDLLKSSEIIMQNHPDHQRVLLSRHASKSEGASQNEKGISMMMQTNHLERDLLNRHASDSSESPSQNEKSNMNLMMQSSHAEHGRDLLNRHGSESSERSLQMQSHADGHLMAQHSESHRSMNNPVPLIRLHNRVSQGSGLQGSGSRAMMPHLHHMGATPSSEQIMPCLHPVPSKQY